MGKQKGNMMRNSFGTEQWHNGKKLLEETSFFFLILCCKLLVGYKKQYSSIPEKDDEATHFFKTPPKYNMIYLHPGCS